MLIHQSVWPIYIAINLNCTVLILLDQMNSVSIGLLQSFVISVWGIINWYVDFYKEAMGGDFYNSVWLSVMVGFMLFLLSELFYFIGLFWSLLSNKMSPTLTSWPPTFIKMEFSYLPIIGTLLLIGSSFTVTSAHHLIHLGYRKLSVIALVITIAMGISFIAVELLEFYFNPFTISDGILGSTFYMILGTHLSHVIIGIIALTCLTLSVHIHSSTAGRGTLSDCAIYYWHFVDLIWLFVYTMLYLT